MTLQQDDALAMGQSQHGQTAAATLALFTSMGTLVCCALPALFVSLGAGAVLAGLASTFPALVVLSEHKSAVFGVGAVMLMIAVTVRYRSRNAPCPLDARLAASCQRMRRISGIILYSAIALYLVGFFFAFLAARLLS